MAGVDVTALAIEVKSVGITSASQALGGLSTSAANAEKRIIALVAATDKLQASSVASALAAQNYMTKLQQQSAMMQTLATGSASAAGSTQALAAAMALLAASLNTLNANTQAATRSQSQHNEGMREAHGLARGLSGGLGMLWLSYSAFIGTTVGLGIALAMKEAVTGFAKVEYQMTFVKALAEDTTHSVGELTARMHDVAGALGIAPEAAAKGLRALTQAGLNTSDALATLPVAFKLATVGELALESAALAATGVMNAYDLKVQNLEHIGDVMAKAGAMSAASVDSISVSMKYSAGTAEQYGVSLEKLGSILTLLGKRGITGSSAGVAANNLIAELYSPSSEKAIKAAAALGVKAYVDGVRQPVEDVVQSFKTGLAKFDAEGQGMLLEAMFGKKGGKAMYAIAGATKEEFKALETQLVNSTGFVADVYKANLKTVEGQLNLTKSAITNMFAKVGEESSAPIKDLLLSIRNMAQSQGAQDMFIGLTQSIKTFITTVVPAAATLGALFLSFKVGAAMTVAWTAAIGFAETAISIGLIPAVKALNIAMMSNPFGLVLGVITLLAGAYMLLKRNKESVHDLHKTDMAHAAETLKAGNDEIEMLKKQLTLRGQNIRGDGEMTAIKEMQANEQVQAIQQRIIDNNTKIYSTAGKNRGPSQMGSAGNGALEKELESANAAARENKQLEKDLAVAQGTYKQLADQNKNINDLKKRLREEDKRMDDEDLKNATPKVVGNQKYNGNEKGLKSAAADAYQASVLEQQGIIKASKTAMQNFEDTQNNLFKAGEIGKLKFIQDVGNKQIAELANQHVALEALVKNAPNKKNPESDKRKFGDELKANEIAANTAKVKLAEETNVQLAQYAQDNTRFQIQELETQGKFGAAAALKFSSENKLAFKQAEQDIADFGDKFPIITERFKQLGAARDAAVNAGNNKEALYNFNVEADKLRNTLKGVQTATEGQGLAFMFEAAQSASAKFAEQLPILQAEIEAMKSAPIVDTKGIEEAQARLRGLGEDQRKLWEGVGTSITKSLKDAFGKSGEAVGGLIKVAQNYSNLSDKTDSARVKAYGDAAGAAKGFFKEGTTGYKMLEGAERAFRLLELAGMVQSLVMTGTVEAGKQAFKIPTVLMEFMSWMGPWGLAAGAAAIAAIGVSASSGSGGGFDVKARQEKQSTGSVLGASDAKSESITNSLTILEKNSGLGLAHSTTMIHYLKNVSDNIAGLSTALMVKAGVDITKGPADYVNGGFIGKISNSIFGGNKTTLDTGISTSKDSLQNTLAGSMNAVSYNQTKTDGGWFSSDKYSTEMKSLGAETNSQFTKIIQGMTDSIKAAAVDLGMGGDEFTAHLNTFIVDIGTISAKGLTGDEVKKALEAAFSKLGDDMAKFAIEGLDKFQKVGEGYLETVVRVANDLIQVKDVFAALDKTFNLTGIAAVNVSESLITAVGGLDRLGEGAKFFVDNFLTEAEKMGPITASVRGVMEGLHYGNVTTIEDFSKLVRSLDLTDPAAQALYGSLMDVAPAFKEAADYADKLTKALDAKSKAFTDAAQGIDDALRTIGDTVKGFADKVKATTAAVVTSQDNISSAYFKAQDDVVTAQSKVNDLLRKSADDMKAFSLTIKDFLETLTPSNASMNSLKAKFSATAVLASGGDAQAQKDVLTIAKSLLDKAKAESRNAKEYQFTESMVKSSLAGIATAMDKRVADSTAPATEDPMVKASADLLAAQGKLTEYAALAYAVGANTDRSTVKLAGSVDTLYAAFVTATANDATARADYATALTLTSNLALTSSNNLSGLLGNLKSLQDAQVTFLKARDDLTKFVLDTEKSSSNLDLFADQLVQSLGLTGAAADSLKAAFANPATAAIALGDLLGTKGGIAGTLPDVIAALKGTGTQADSLAALLGPTVLGGAAIKLVSSLDLVGNAAQALVALMNSFAYTPPVAATPPVAVQPPAELSQSQQFLTGVYTDVLKRIPDAAGMAFWADKMAAGVITLSSAATEIAMSAANNSDASKFADQAASKDWLKAHNIPGFAVGTNSVPYDMVAQIHQGERIIPAADNRQLMSHLSGGNKSAGTDNSELIAVIESLRSEVAGLKAAAEKTESNTRDTKNILRRVTEDGESIKTKAVTK